MKQHFKGYYGSSEEEIRALWSSATIVFDANVLLDSTDTSLKPLQPT